MQRRAKPPPPPISYLSLSVLAAPLGEAAAAEGQGTLNAPGVDCSSCDFDRARSFPAKIIKGAKKAAYYSKTRHSPQRLSRRLASPFFLPAALSYNKVLTVAQLDKAHAACAGADAARPDEQFCHEAHVSPSFAPSPHLTRLFLSVQGREIGGRVVKQPLGRRS
jgi:hypothetical protein